MAKNGSRRGNTLRRVANIFDRPGRNKAWADSVKRLTHEAATADKQSDKRKRNQFARLRAITQ